MMKLFSTSTLVMAAAMTISSAQVKQEVPTDQTLSNTVAIEQSADFSIASPSLALMVPDSTYPIINPHTNKPPMPVIVDDTTDLRDANGNERARYYGEGVEIILGRVIRWCIENNFQIQNSGGGAGGTVIVRGEMRTIQKVSGTPETGEHAENLCADCGSNSKGQYIANEAFMTIRVRSIRLGRTKVTIDFSTKAPAGATACKSTGKLEKMILDNLLKP